MTYNRRTYYNGSTITIEPNGHNPARIIVDKDGVWMAEWSAKNERGVRVAMKEAEKFIDEECK